MYKRHSWRDDSKVLACQKLVRDAERKEQKKRSDSCTCQNARTLQKSNKIFTPLTYYIVFYYST